MGLSSAWPGPGDAALLTSGDALPTEATDPAAVLPAGASEALAGLPKS